MNGLQTCVCVDIYLHMNGCLLAECAELFRHKGAISEFHEQHPEVAAHISKESILCSMLWSTSIVIKLPTELPIGLPIGFPIGPCVDGLV